MYRSEHSICVIVYHIEERQGYESLGVYLFKVVITMYKQTRNYENINKILFEGQKPHTHHGCNHNEYDSKKGASNLTPKEKRMVDKVIKNMG